MKARKTNGKNKKKKDKILSEAELNLQLETEEKIEKDRSEEKTKENKRKELTNNFIKLKRKYLSRESFDTPYEYEKLSGFYRKFVDIVVKNDGDPEKIKASSLNLKAEDLTETFALFFGDLVRYQRRELLTEILTKYLGVDFLIPVIEQKSGIRHGFTAAQVAAECGEFSMFDYILRLKKIDNSPISDVNLRDPLGKNLLYYALIVIGGDGTKNFSIKKMRDLIDYLCDAGLDLNSQSINGRTILHDILVEIKKEDSVSDFLKDSYNYLLTKGANDNIEDYSNQKITALEMFEVLEAKEVKKLVNGPNSEQKVSTEEKSLSEKSLFEKIRDFEDNLPEIIRILAATTENDFLEVDDKGYNMVHYAAHHGIYEIFYNIVNKKNIDKINNDKMTPIMCAAKNNWKGAVLELVKFGADITIKNKFGENLMHSAASKGWIDVLKLAVSNKKLLLTTSNEGYLPIHKAVSYGNIGVLKYLLEIGQDINVKASNGNTLLHIAAQRGHVKIFNYLIEMGADQTIKNKSGILSGEFLVCRVTKKMTETSFSSLNPEITGIKQIKKFEKTFGR